MHALSRRTERVSGPITIVQLAKGQLSGQGATRSVGPIEAEGCLKGKLPRLTPYMPATA